MGQDQLEGQLNVLLRRGPNLDEEFWEELGSESPRAAKVVQIYKDYKKVMEKAGVPYRYS